MTCLALEHEVPLVRANTGDAVRAAVFWTFILLIIASPAALSALILLRV